MKQEAAIAGNIAPGTRVEIRGAEWIVRRKDRTSTGDWSLLCVGVSEIVRSREARFLESLERSLSVLDPAETELVADDSPPEYTPLFGGHAPAVARNRKRLVDRTSRCH